MNPFVLFVIVLGSAAGLAVVGLMVYLTVQGFRGRNPMGPALVLGAVALVIVGHQLFPNLQP
jgi:prepilin signal peptidase PulO-like enzyme (type II secretory pathway)